MLSFAFSDSALHASERVMTQVFKTEISLYAKLSKKKDICCSTATQPYSLRWDVNCPYQGFNELGALLKKNKKVYEWAQMQLKNSAIKGTKGKIRT